LDAYSEGGFFFDAGSSGDSACPPDPAPAPTVASTGTVTFEVTNTSTADRYIIAQGQSCDPFDISGQQLSVPPPCICECTLLSGASFTLTTVSAGKSTALSWDGRHVVPNTTYVDCSAYGNPGVCATVAGGSAQPGAPGPLAVSIAYATQVTPGNASGCAATVGGFKCTGSAARTWAATPMSSTRCAAGALRGLTLQIVTQTFTLPASGDTVVPVSIP
jgi:hypothetical protein